MEKKVCFDEIENVIKKYNYHVDRLISILLDVQKITPQNYVAEDSMKFIAKILNVPASYVFGVASFYSMISLRPRGKYVIEICSSAPCYVNGAFDIAKEFENLLGIKVGETTPDGIITLEYVSCFGACSVAPAVKVGDKIYGKLNRNKIEVLIEELREGGLIECAK